MKLFAITLTWLSLFAASCQACDYSALTLAQSVGQASDVFVGTVRSVETHGGLLRGRIMVERSWKGVTAGRQVTVYTSWSSCGVDMRRGQKVMIFGRRTAPELPGQLFTEQPDGSGGDSVNVDRLTAALGPPVTTWNPTGWWPWK
jgi:hypothetical protein